MHCPCCPGAPGTLAAVLRFAVPIKFLLKREGMGICGSPIALEYDSWILVVGGAVVVIVYLSFVCLLSFCRFVVCCLWLLLFVSINVFGVFVCMMLSMRLLSYFFSAHDYYYYSCRYNPLYYFAIAGDTAVSIPVLITSAL